MTKLSLNLARMLVAGTAMALLAAGCLPAQGLSVGEDEQLEGYGLRIDEQHIEAILQGGAAYVDFPIERTDVYEGAMPAEVTVAVRSLEGVTFGVASTGVEIDGDRTVVQLEIPGVPAGLTNETLGSYNLEFHVDAGGGQLYGKRSLFAVVKRVDTVVVGSDVLVSGGQGSVRVTVTDQSGTMAIPDAAVEVDFVPEAVEGEPAPAAVQLWSGSTDEAGVARVWFPVVPAYEGAGDLVVRAIHESGSSESHHSIQVQRARRILVTTDKPLYQPGQTMHLRALVMDDARTTPVSGETVTFEVRDGKGNKVMKKEIETNSFGVAHTTFVLARMVNMGRYQISAIQGDTTQEKTVTVDRYALPKFKVDLAMDRDYYLPAQTAHGTLTAEYTFGEPVGNADVSVTLYQYVGDWSVYSTVDGRTGDTGGFEFDVALPSYLVGLPLEQGGSLMKMEVQVTDGAGSSRVIEQGITISQNNVVVQAIPERRLLAAGVENVVWLVAATPSGSPAVVNMNVQINYGTAVPVVTDEMGFGEIRFVPTAGSTNLYVTGQDAGGSTFYYSFYLSTDSAGEDVVLLRTDKSLYKVGDPLGIDIIAPRANDRVYLDIVKNGQTLLEDIVEVVDHRGEKVVDLGDDMAGTLAVSVYYIADDGNIIRDQRVVYVEGSSGLLVSFETDRDEYRPAETARLGVRVMDVQGRPTQAAVGIAVVDEAVFALSEMKPGMEQTYFNLEDEIREPTVTIYGWSVESLFPDGHAAVDDADAQEAAKVLFASASGSDVFGIYYSSKVTLFSSMLTVAGTYVQTDLQSIIDALDSYLRENSDSLLGAPSARSWVNARRDTWFDPWGQNYLAEMDTYGTFTLKSAGVDETWGTTDDVTRTKWVNTDPARADDANGWDPDVDFDGEEPGGAADAASDTAGPPSDSHDKSEEEGVRVREYFPETLLVEPALITDEEGFAEIDVSLADSITTWRVSGLANSAGGLLGSSTAGIRVFQPFFIDVNFPAALTLGDTITVPVAVYNYTEAAQEVTLTVEDGDWFTLLTPATQGVTVEAMSASSVPCTITADVVGWHSLEASGYAGGEADAVRRSIEVMPSGQEKTDGKSDMIEGTAEGTEVVVPIAIPAAAIDGASELLVKVYPGMFSQAVEGLDSILQMPSGCFEQTSSSTYPNVMVLDYLQTSGQTTPEVELKAREYINLGYQRLLTYEVSGGGFSWFGEAPAHNVLTAYGLMEFGHMAKVHPVDEAVISRTQAWLVGGQASDGSWVPTDGGIAEGAIDNYENNVLRTTAYVLWALVESGYEGAAMDRAVSYITAHKGEAADAYTQAIIAVALVGSDPDSAVARDMMDALAASAVIENGAAHWEGGSDAGLTYSTGDAHAIETTAITALAFMRSGSNIDLAQQALVWLVRNKDSFGNWETTQATVYSLLAMITAIEGSGAPAEGTIQVFHNGALAETLAITAADYDVFRQVDLKTMVVEGGNEVRVVFTGSGTLMYQVVGTYWEPWAGSSDPGTGPVGVDVTYDHTSLTTDDTVEVTVAMHNRTDENLLMVMLDLGVPPGFTVMTEDLDALVTAGTFARYEMTGRQIIVYFEVVAAGDTTFSYRMKADNPIEAEAPASRVWLYYNPEIESFSEPIRVNVN